MGRDEGGIRTSDRAARYPWLTAITIAPTAAKAPPIGRFKPLNCMMMKWGPSGPHVPRQAAGEDESENDLFAGQLHSQRGPPMIKLASTAPRIVFIQPPALASTMSAAKRDGRTSCSRRLSIQPSKP